MYRVYVISNNGDGMVTRLEDWDGGNTLKLYLSTFASDAVIEVEPVNE